MRAYINTYDNENLDILTNSLKDKKYEIISSLEEMKEKKYSVDDFDLVAITLYPFENYMDKDMELDTILNSIDIDHVNMIRFCAKNYQKKIILTSNDDFKIDLDEIDENKKQNLALKAFNYISKYDYLINQKLSKEFNSKETSKAFYLNELQELKYGENPHQKASIYSYDKEINYKQLQGEKLSYNNILDYTNTLEIMAEFFDVSACVIVKHANPSQVALADNINHTFEKAIDSDPISPFKGVVGFTKEVSAILAKKLSIMMLDTIIAPSFEPKALEILKSDKNLKVIEINTDLQEILKFNEEEIKLTPFGIIIQEKDTKDLDVKTFKVVSNKKPTQEEVEDMIFAFKVAKHVKSHAVVVAKDLRTIGICASGSNQASAIEIALSKVCDSPKDSVVASDGLFDSIDTIHIMAQNRVSATIQPAGSIKDKEIIDTVDKLGMAMITTGIRHFKH